MGHSHLDPRAGFQANAQSFQSSFSFSYRIDISVHATITQAGLQFQGAQFIPARGTPYGRMEFLIATTTACNIRMFGISGHGAHLRQRTDHVRCISGMGEWSRARCMGST